MRTVLSFHYFRLSLANLLFCKLNKCTQSIFESSVLCTVLGTLNKVFLCACQVVDPVIIHLGYGSKQNHRNPFGFWWGRDISECVQ